MFEKTHIEAFFAELEQQWRSSPEFDRLSRDAHLGIALWDAWAARWTASIPES